MDQPAEAPGVDVDVPVQNNARPDVNAEGVGEVNVPAPNNVGQQGQAQGQAQDDVNWNLMEWDRAEELTWERLLGLDGSLVFLEHVFWVASLNTLFILVFGKKTCRMWRNLLNSSYFIFSILSLSHRALHNRWFQDERLGVSVPL